MSRRVLLILAGLLLAAGAAAYLFRGTLAVQVFREGASRRLAADPIGAFPDGLHVTLCGAGGPLPDAERSAPCVAVVADDRLFVVDAGSGSARNLGVMRLPPSRVVAVLLTHYHSDHIDGLGELSVLRWAGGAHERPLPVHGPGNVRQVVEGFNDAYRADARYRIAHHGPEVTPPSGAGLTADSFPEPGPSGDVVVVKSEGLVVRAFAVDHRPASPSVGYRFDYGDRSVVISGDTVRSSNVLRMSRGVDLLVHEALSERLVGILHRRAKSAGRENLARITADIPEYHTTPLQAARLAEEADVGHLLFYHVVPPLPVPGLEATFLRGVDATYGGPVTLGRDGVTVSLPRGRQVIRVSQRL